MDVADSAGLTRRGFVQGAGVVATGLGLGSVMGTATADAATVAPWGLNLGPPAVNPTTQSLVSIPPAA
jgi:hypothetical protein